MCILSTFYRWNVCSWIPSLVESVYSLTRWSLFLPLQNSFPPTSCMHSFLSFFRAAGLPPQLLWRLIANCSELPLCQRVAFSQLKPLKRILLPLEAPHSQGLTDEGRKAWLDPLFQGRTNSRAQPTLQNSSKYQVEARLWLRHFLLSFWFLTYPAYLPFWKHPLKNLSFSLCI